MADPSPGVAQVGAVLSTVAQLDALPLFTVLVMEPQRMGYGEGTAPYAVQKLWHGRFVSRAFSDPVLSAAALLDRYGPLTVAWRPAPRTEETR